MSSVLKKVCIGFLLVVLLDRSIAFLFLKTVFPRTFSGESGGTINYVVHKKEEVDFLILGASRAKHGIDPKALTSLSGTGHNLGINGTTPLNSLLVLDILLQKGVRPKTIILQTDLYTYGKNNDAEILDQIKRMYHYDTPLVREYVAKQGMAENIRYTSHLYRLNRKMLNITFNFAKSFSIKEYNGYVPLPPTRIMPEPTLLDTAFVYDIDSENSKALRKMQELCDEHGVELIVVLPPFYKDALSNKKESDTMIRGMRTLGVKNIIDLSSSNSTKELSAEKYWRDATHFNDEGAQLFSRLLNKELSVLKKTSPSYAK